MNLFSTLYPSPIGNLKIQCTATHITSVLFNDEPADFKNEYHTLLQLCIDQFNEYFAGKRKAFQLPLNQPGTKKCINNYIFCLKKRELFLRLQKMKFVGDVMQAL